MDKNGSKLDVMYRKIVVDTPSLEVFDKKGNKLEGLYRKCEPNIEGEKVFGRSRNILDGKYIKVDSDPREEEEEIIFDKHGNKLDGYIEIIIIN